MTREEYTDIFEKLNAEYLDIVNSDEYRKGVRQKKLLYALKRLKFNEIYDYYLKAKKRKKVLRIVNKEEIGMKSFYEKGFLIPDANGVVYTCITDGYDIPKQPMVSFRGLEFYLFSDQLYKDINQWKNIDIKKYSLDAKGKDINRYFKMHPYELFENKDFAVYLDGNVQVISDIAPLYSIAKNSKVGIALHLHNERRNIYEEAKACLAYGKGDTEKISKQIVTYNKEGFPASFPLFEATVIVFDLHNLNGKMVMKHVSV